MATRAEVVATVAVEITADVDKFVKRFSRELKSKVAAETKAERYFAPLEKEAERAGQKSGVSFSVQFDREVRKRSTSFSSSAKKSGGLFGKAFSKGGAEEATGFLAKIGQGLSSFAEGIPGLSQLSGLLSKIGLADGPAAAGAIATLGPAIIGLAFDLIGLIGYLAQLSGLLGALPAAAVVFGATIAPLIIALHGFGGALAAIASGDPKKIQAALKGLSPSAQAAAREIGGLLPQLRALRSSVQESFFGQFRGDLTAVGHALLPTLTRGLSSVAVVLGKLAGKGLQALATPEVAAALDKIFTTAVKVLGIMAGPLGDAAGAFGQAIIAALPAVLILAKIFGGLIEKFAGKFADFINSGKFEEWILAAIPVGHDLLDLVSALLDLFLTLFGEFGGDGKTLLQEITGLVRQFTRDLKDPSVRLGIAGMIDLFKAFAVIILGVVASFGVIAVTIGAIVEGIITAYTWLAKLLGLVSKNKGVQEGSSGALDLGVRRSFPGAGAFHDPTRGGGRTAFAVGGIVDRPTSALLGEAGPEAVVPLNNSARARQVLAQAGIDTMDFGAPGLVVNVWLGTEQITDILDARVDKGLSKQARSLRSGARE